MMNQTVNGSSRGHGVFENLLPSGKGQIACQHYSATFIAISQQRKEHLHLFATLLNITYIINDQYVIVGAQPYEVFTQTLEKLGYEPTKGGDV